MRYHEITEGRLDGITLAYHATSVDAAVAILHSGIIKPETGARINDLPSAITAYPLYRGPHP